MRHVSQAIISFYHDQADDVSCDEGLYRGRRGVTPLGNLQLQIVGQGEGHLRLAEAVAAEPNPPPPDRWASNMAEV